jgi:hypothetical protein
MIIETYRYPVLFYVHSTAIFLAFRLAASLVSHEKSMQENGVVVTGDRELNVLL